MEIYFRCYIIGAMRWVTKTTHLCKEWKWVTWSWRDSQRRHTQTLTWSTQWKAPFDSYSGPLIMRLLSPTLMRIWTGQTTCWTLSHLPQGSWSDSSVWLLPVGETTQFWSWSSHLPLPHHQQLWSPRWCYSLSSRWTTAQPQKVLLHQHNGFCQWGKRVHLPVKTLFKSFTEWGKIEQWNDKRWRGGMCKAKGAIGELWKHIFGTPHPEHYNSLRANYFSGFKRKLLEACLTVLRENYIFC